MDWDEIDQILVDSVPEEHSSKVLDYISNNLDYEEYGSYYRYRVNLAACELGLAIHGFGVLGLTDMSTISDLASRMLCLGSNEKIKLLNLQHRVSCEGAMNLR